MPQPRRNCVDGAERRLCTKKTVDWCRADVFYAAKDDARVITGARTLGTRHALSPRRLNARNPVDNRPPSSNGGLPPDGRPYSEGPGAPEFGEVLNLLEIW
jgi:hypothetical protein